MDESWNKETLKAIFEIIRKEEKNRVKMLERDNSLCIPYLLSKFY